MEEVKAGDTVKIHYTGAFENGDIFDSSEEGEPFEFTVGAQMVIDGFDKAVLGMKEGETKSVVIRPEDGYGLRSDEMIITIERSRIPAEIALDVGTRLGVRSDSGFETTMTVADLNGDMVTLDGNHPLAGQTLVFTLRMMEIHRA